MKILGRIRQTRDDLKCVPLASAIGAAVLLGSAFMARADLVGHWLSGAPNLSDTSGYRSAGTHDGVAVGGNAGALAFSTDVPAGCSGQTLDLTPGNVGVSINNSATGDSGYQNTFDDLIRSEFTIAFWAKGFPGTWGPWVCKRGEDGIGWQLRRMGNDPIAGFTLRGVDNDDGWGSAINVSDNQPIWHHYAGVWNQTTGTRMLYVDGVFSHVVNNNTAQVMTQATGKHLAIGVREQGGSGWESYFSGKLFDVRIYNTPLTQNQVLELLPPTTPSGLAATPGNAKVGLLWTPKPGATGYTVSTKNSVTNVEQIDTTNDAFFSKTGLVNGTIYTFKILSTNSMGSSAYSSEVSTTPVLGSAKDILTLNFSGQGPATLVGTNIIKDVPVGTDVSNLTATYTISPFATPDAANPSGASENFTNPRTYTITAENGSTKSYTVTVNVVAPVTYNFDDGLQGWTQIWPTPANGRLWNNNQLGAGYDRDDAYTRMGRSPEFYLNNLGDLSFWLDGGQSPLATPGVAPSAIPEFAIDGGGFGGLALRDVATDTYVMSKRHNGYGNWQQDTFSAADLAPYAHNGRKYTVDYIDSNMGGWGWTYMDNVSIPGTLAPAAKFTDFSIFGVPSMIGSNITLAVPFGSDVTALAPSFTLSPGATCDKASGSTHNFTSPVTYTVTSSDALVTTTYTVAAVVQPDPATGLVGHWASGPSNLTDSSGFSPAGTHDGVAAGGNASALAFNADDVPGTFGGSSLDLRAGNVGVLVANSSNTDGAYVNTFDDLLRKQCTVAFWAKGFPNVWAPWVSKKGENGVGWQVRRFSSDSNACFTVRGLNNDDGTSNGTNINDSNPTWHHIAAVWNQATGTRTIYVDGALSSVEKNVIGQTMSLSPDMHLMLGARQQNPDTNYDGYFSGLLYDVRIYQQALFSNQVQTVMTTSATPQAPDAKIRSFGLPGLPGFIVNPNISWSLPVGTNTTSLAPTFTLTAGATCSPVSGTTRDFTTPQTYTVTSSDSLVTTVYTVTVSAGSNFADGTLQGWHNRVWDASAGAWTDLDPNVITMPASINGGVIQPPSGDDYLFRNVGGVVWPNGGQNDNHLNTVWLRSPLFYLNGSGDLTVQLAKGMAHGLAPADDMSVPYASQSNNGWKGVALRSASNGAFLLAKPRTTEGDAMVTVTFTAAELAPYIGVACTLDLINSCNGGWGWLVMGNVSVPGSGTPPPGLTPEARILAFGTTGTPAVIVEPNISWPLPVGTHASSLAPTFVLSPGATCTPASGTTRNFTTPQTYTVTSSDSLTTTVYTVTVSSDNNFNDGTLQGWHNRVWDAGAGAWVDLDPNVITLPANINGGVIQPPSSADYLYKAAGGFVWPNGGDTDNHLNSLWLRSPLFYLNGSGDITVQMAMGMALGAAPTDDMSVPYAALADGGWKGVALRRASDGVFVIAKPRTTIGDPATVTFTAAELAPYVGIACTLDLMNTCRGGWGWLTMGNVSIPGSSTPPAAADPFTSWITTHYPGLSDKSPGGTPDGDGINNLTKFAFGLIPGSSASVNPITSKVNKTTGMFQYTRRDPAVSGLTYTVWTSTNLQTWVTDASAGQAVVSTTGDVQTVSVTLSGAPLSAPKLFVQVRAQ